MRTRKQMHEVGREIASVFTPLVHKDLLAIGQTLAARYSAYLRSPLPFLEITGTTRSAFLPLRSALRSNPASLSTSFGVRNRKGLPIAPTTAALLAIRSCIIERAYTGLDHTGNHLSCPRRCPKTACVLCCGFEALRKAQSRPFDTPRTCPSDIAWRDTELGKRLGGDTVGCSTRAGF